MEIIFIFSCSGMFRIVPACSGMFRVPGVIDAHKNALSLEKGEIRIKTQGREWEN